GVGIERKKCGDTASLAFWQGLAPACFFGGKLQNALEPRRVERRCLVLAKPRNFAVASNKLQAKRQRILAGGSREFVNEALDDEAAAGVLDGSPPGTRHARLS